MKIGITGASGFIGAHVARLARSRGHKLVAFSRQPRPQPDFDESRLFSLDQPVDLSGLDAVVHLAGETIMGLWTPAKKRRIQDSRVLGTRRVVEGLVRSSAPKIFVCGSAIGFYGDTAERVVDETAPAGKGFLAEVATAWEAEAAQAGGTRTTNVRTGFVLGASGGAMRLMKPAFQLGLGGRLGNGRQWMSCVHVDDVAGIILHAIETDSVAGPLNAVALEPVRNADFTRLLGRAVRRPTAIPAPAFALKVGLGELSHLLLDSQRVIPEATLAAGYVYRHPSVERAIAAAVNGA